MSHNYKYRFELRPGKHVYVPTPEAIAYGEAIVADVRKHWQPANYFYHFGKMGGHVAAMRPHVSRRYKASIDLKNFFGNVTRSKVSRSLVSIGKPSKEAFSIATESCVVDGQSKFLPYGFVQSMALATLAVENSSLGRCIANCRASGLIVTMYVDDILMSSDDLKIISSAYEDIIASIESSNFSVSASKCSPPSSSVEAFNCIIQKGKIEVSDPRMNAFRDQLIFASEDAREAILRYVSVLNVTQASQLAVS
jgi:hypothetical protein